MGGYPQSLEASVLNVDTTYQHNEKAVVVGSMNEGSPTTTLTGDDINYTLDNIDDTDPTAVTVDVKINIEEESSNSLYGQNLYMAQFTLFWKGNRITKDHINIVYETYPSLPGTTFPVAVPATSYNYQQTSGFNHFVYIISPMPPPDPTSTASNSLKFGNHIWWDYGSPYDIVMANNIAFCKLTIDVSSYNN